MIKNILMVIICISSLNAFSQGRGNGGKFCHDKIRIALLDLKISEPAQQSIIIQGLPVISEFYDAVLRGAIESLEDVSSENLVLYVEQDRNKLISGTLLRYNPNLCQDQNMKVKLKEYLEWYFKVYINNHK